MSFLTVEELIEARAKNPGLHIDDYQSHGVAYGPLTPVMAQDILDRVKQATLDFRHLKINRPWALINLTEKLDPEQPWIGFELECGWDRHDDYTKVVNYVMDQLTHVVIDREGNSDYPSEITFPPENYNDYIEGKAQILQFYDRLESEKLLMARPTNHCGTHLNISTPSFRKLGENQRYAVSSALNQGIFAMTSEALLKVFGRHPYGLGHCRRGNVAQAPWIEYKVFLSTQNKARFLDYLEVSKNMAAIMEKLSSEYTLEWAKKTYRRVNPHDSYSAPNPQQEVIWNLQEILLGEETEPKYVHINPIFGNTGSMGYGAGNTIRQHLASLEKKKAA